MKNILKSTISKIIKSNNGWKLLGPYAKLGKYMYSERNDYSIHKSVPDLKTLSTIFNKKEVLHGPFAKMKYPSFESTGSSLYSKLIGSYEREIHDVISIIQDKDYSVILDIGSAEGYYAVGLSLLHPNIEVYAYDINEKARLLCSEMAILNKVEQRVKIREFCTSEELLNFNFRDKGLIICDCEGYEMELFNEENIKNLANCDLLIETHDFIDINISSHLTKLFSNTHNVTVIKSIDDIEKAKTYYYKETAHLSLIDKYYIYKEERPTIMEWLFLTPKDSISSR